MRLDLGMRWDLGLGYVSIPWHVIIELNVMVITQKLFDLKEQKQFSCSSAAAEDDDDGQCHI